MAKLNQEQQKQLEEVRERLELLLCGGMLLDKDAIDGKGQLWVEDGYYFINEETRRAIISQILSGDGILIKEKDQSLPALDPHNYSTGCFSCGAEVGTVMDVELGMQILRDYGFVKAFSAPKKEVNKSGRDIKEGEDAVK